MGTENQTKKKEKENKRIQSCVRREIILVALHWEQSSTAVKQRQYRCSI